MKNQSLQLVDICQLLVLLTLLLLLALLLLLTDYITQKSYVFQPCDISYGETDKLGMSPGCVNWVDLVQLPSGTIQAPSLRVACYVESILDY